MYLESALILCVTNKHLIQFNIDPLEIEAYEVMTYILYSKWKTCKSFWR